MSNGLDSLKVFLHAAPTAQSSDERARPIQIGVISFCIPDHGVLFRCRIRTEKVSLLHSTTLTAVRFIEKSHVKNPPKRVMLHIDDSPYYFALTHSLGAKNEIATTLHKSLSQLKANFSIEPILIPQEHNKARGASIDLPAHPMDVKPLLNLSYAQPEQKPKMLPLQDGLEL